MNTQKYPKKKITLPNKQQERVWREITIPIFPNIVYKCSLTFKRGDAINMDSLHWYGSFCIDANLRSFLLYMYISVLD